ncbi:MAG: ACP S-malonyltransferase [Candidatus Kapabacteria bacterium]|jgi:[acyl-carrier-protein] S-malonyltransferase|nr:ACP S-malonyltransferase [Candidatus Kapabacteria bacterium]
MKALVFSGQGSQYVGMSADLAQQFPQAAARLQEANDILGYDCSKIMASGPDDVLKQTRYTQPALFIHEAILLDLTGLSAEATAVAGHSLGEYSALYAAGVLGFADALRLVNVRATQMYDVGNAVPGTMAAIVGLDDDKVLQLCALFDGKGGERIVAANFNAPGQVVISGSADYVRALLPEFKNAGAKLVKELTVSGAFHSPLLEGALPPLQDALMATTFENARCDVYVNVTAQAIRSGHALREALAQQLVAPVLWTQSINTMYNAGIKQYVEIGPGKVLQGLIKRIAPEASVSGIDTAADVAAFLERKHGATQG